MSSGNTTNNVCDDQTTFNTAYAKAVNNYGNYMDKKKTPSQRILYTMMAFLQLMFIIWAVILSMKMPGPNRPVNVTFAIITGPIYIIAYYISMAGNGNGSSKTTV